MHRIPVERIKNCVCAQPMPKESRFCVVLETRLPTASCVRAAVVEQTGTSRYSAPSVSLLHIDCSNSSPPLEPKLLPLPLHCLSDIASASLNPLLHWSIAIFTSSICLSDCHPRFWSTAPLKQTPTQHSRDLPIDSHGCFDCCPARFQVGQKEGCQGHRAHQFSCS